MEKFVEVVAISNFKTVVVMTTQVEKDEDLEIAVDYAMYKVKELNTKVEKFKLETVRVINTSKETKL